MKATASVLLVASFLVVTAGASCPGYRYSLPGSLLWPSATQWAELGDAVSGELFVRGQEGYNLSALYKTGIFNSRNGWPEPAAIARPDCVADVQALMLFARMHQLRVAVFNTGHNNDVRNTADNALLIHMKAMRNVTLDLDEHTVTMGGGATFDDVLPFVHQQSQGKLVALGGSVPTVGVWGWAVGGGIGPLTRQYGLAVDAIVSVTVVTAEGKVVTATADNEHKELLWAIKGGAGPAFGVGVSLTMKVFPHPGSMRTYIGLYYQMNSVSDAYAAVLKKAPYNAFAYYLVTVPGTVRVMAFCSGGSSCDAFMAGIAALPSCLQYSSILCMEFTTQYPVGFLNIFRASSLPARSEWAFGGTRTQDLTATFRDVNTWTLQQGTAAYGKQCWAEALMGGISEMLDAAGCSTSVGSGMRAVQQYVICIVSWDASLSAEDQAAALDDLHAFEQASLATRSPQQWVYWNEAQHRFAGDEWKARYWGSVEKYNKLLDVKLAYDATNFLTCHHCVGWSFDETVDPNICPSSSCSCSNNPTGQCSLYEEDLPTPVPGN